MQAADVKIPRAQLVTALMRDQRADVHRNAELHGILADRMPKGDIDGSARE